MTFYPKEVIGKKKPLIVTPLIIKLLRNISPSFNGSINLLMYMPSLYLKAKFTAKFIFKLFLFWLVNRIEKNSYHFLVFGMTSAWDFF